MKITVEKSVLEALLIKAIPFTEKKDMSAVVSHVLMTASKSGLEVKAFNYEMGLKVKAPIHVEEEGVTTVNPKRLYEIVRICQDGEILLEVINNNLVVKQNHSVFKLPSFDVKEFPEMVTDEKHQKIKFNFESLTQKLNQIAPSVDLNNPKHELNGVLLNITKHQIDIVGTDTYRLSLTTIERESNNEGAMIIPKWAVTEMVKLFSGDVEIMYNERSISIQSANTFFMTKLISGSYPPYAQVVPQRLNFNFAIDKEILLNAMQQVLVVNNVVSFDISQDKIVASAKDPQNSSLTAKTDFSCNTGVSEPMKINVNGRFLIDFIKASYSDYIWLGVNTPEMPIVLQEEALRTIIMPIIE